MDASDDSEVDLTDEDSEDELVDDSDDREDDFTDEGSEGESDNDLEDESNNEPVLPKKKISAEARFTRRFTEYYDLIGVHFPVLLRLRELAKLSAISKILRDISRSSEVEKQLLIRLRDSVRKTLTDLGRVITYPICTESKVKALLIFLQSNKLFSHLYCNFSEIPHLNLDQRGVLENIT